MKPIIGITTFEGSTKGFHTINNSYMNAVFAAGGIPVNIPTIKDEGDYDSYLNILDGIIFSGGNDISPLCYNENPLKQVNHISSVRDKYEIELFNKAYEKKLPILGICRGLQIANVALGGSLYQDIHAQLSDVFGHQPTGVENDEFHHSVTVKHDTILHNIFQSEKIFVNSNHHQSIKKVGDNLIVSAIAEDSIIEAIEADDERFLLGLQFHPEGMIKKHPLFLNIFKALIQAAKQEK